MQARNGFWAISTNNALHLEVSEGAETEWLEGEAGRHFWIRLMHPPKWETRFGLASTTTGPLPTGAHKS